MKAHVVSVMTLGLALMASQANAIPDWKTVQAAFQQLNNSTVAAGLDDLDLEIGL